MKTFLLIPTLLAVCFSGCVSSRKNSDAPVIIPPSTVSAQPIPEGFSEVTAKVRSMRGSAYVSAESQWKVLKINQSLPQGSVIRTEADSIVDIFLNNSVVRIMPNTMLALETLLLESTGPEKIYRTILELQQGEIMGNVKKLASTSLYEMKTSKGKARIRGTDFGLCAGGRIASIQGAIVFITAEGEYTINTGEFFDPDTREIKPLPAAPLDLSRFFTCVCGQIIDWESSKSPFVRGLSEAHRNLRLVPMHLWPEREPVEHWLPVSGFCN